MKRRKISLYSYIAKCPSCETVLDMRCVPRSGEGDAPWDVVYTCAVCGLRYALVDRPMYITVEVASGETAEDMNGVFASKSDKQILRMIAAQRGEDI